MFTKNIIFSLIQTANFIQNFLEKKTEQYNHQENTLFEAITRSKSENPWFTIENIEFTLKQWSSQLNEKNIKNWLEKYNPNPNPKKIGLILAGNIPMVGLHDVISVVLSQNIPLIKLSSKDKRLIPAFLEIWNSFSQEKIPYTFVEKLENYDAIIATGSNNTAQYLEQYFKNTPRIIRKNRTSVAVLSGNETDAELKLLANDIFQYFGLGCRNVTHLYIPENMVLDRLFENFMPYSDIINHHSYANNYDYHKAIYLLNQEPFWDNNFVMMKENTQLFCPLSVLHFTRFQNTIDLKEILLSEQENIQCIVSKMVIGLETIPLGEAQNPTLNTYADHIDTLSFLEKL